MTAGSSRTKNVFNFAATLARGTLSKRKENACPLSKLNLTEHHPASD
jgi:hypothetical protein